jgi:hypothetical protein
MSKTQSLWIQNNKNWNLCQERYSSTWKQIIKEKKNLVIPRNTLKRRKAHWIGHILRAKSSNTHYWRDDRRRTRSDGKTRKKTYAAIGWPSGNDRILEIERGRTRSHSVKNSLRKRLLACRKTDCGMNGCKVVLTPADTTRQVRTVCIFAESQKACDEHAIAGVTIHLLLSAQSSPCDLWWTNKFGHALVQGLSLFHLKESFYQRSYSSIHNLGMFPGAITSIPNTPPKKKKMPSHQPLNWRLG